MALGRQDKDRERSSALHGPHRESINSYSVYDGPTRTSYDDPARAHQAAGDPGYERRVEGCWLCRAKILAEAAQEEFFKLSDSQASKPEGVE